MITYINRSRIICRDDMTMATDYTYYTINHDVLIRIIENTHRMPQVYRNGRWMFSAVLLDRMVEGKGVRGNPYFVEIA